jgi:hypothetical protein
VKFERMNAQDLAITLPPKATHPANSVVLLEFNEVPKGGGIRRLSDDVGANQLLAFDAERHNGNKSGADSGLGYGDGKRNNYCVLGWNSPGQWIAWEVRVDKPTSFDVSLNYGKAKGGDYEVRCGDWKSGKTAPTLEGELPWITDAQVDKLGTLALEPGTHRIELRVTKGNNGAEVFRPLELFLTPKKGD